MEFLLVLNQGEAFSVAVVMEQTALLSLAGGKTAGWVRVELDAAAASPWHLLFCTPGVAENPQRCYR